MENKPSFSAIISKAVDFWKYQKMDLCASHCFIVLATYFARGFVTMENLRTFAGFYTLGH